MDVSGRSIGEHSEELRIALVMNGGVSLAVWIGGVTYEINRLVRQQSCYGELLSLTDTTARVDVISGTSAGGLNGALLAMALVHDRDLASLRDLWLEKGSISEMMRSPWRTDLPSFCDGDGYFLSQLRNALSNLRSGPPTDPERVPLDLTITTTLLSGKPKRIPDDFGAVIKDVDHRARFTFRRGPDLEADPFGDDEIADRLALAARCTASFPGAFEASFCPVGSPTKAPLRPDMKGVASFGENRYVVDGGILDNKPLGPALEAIFKQRANRSVRRVLAYVVPDPGALGQEEGDTVDSTPSLADVLIKSVFTLPRVESVSDDLERLKEHNCRVQERRKVRLATITHNSIDQVGQLARTLFPTYRYIRKTSAINYVVSEFSEGLSQKVGRGFGSRGRREWLTERLSLQDLPWVPNVPPLEISNGDLADTDANRTQDDIEAGTHESSSSGWHWGYRPVEHAAEIMIDLLRRTQRLSTALRKPAGIEDAWNRAFDIVADLAALRKRDRGFWRQEAQKPRAVELIGESDSNADASSASVDEVDAWLKQILDSYQKDPFRYSKDRGRACSGRVASAELAMSIAEVLLNVAQVAEHLTARCKQESVDGRVQAEAEDLRRYLGFLVRAPNDAAETVVRRLLAIEVVTDSLGGHGSEVDQLVELVQISADTASPFGGRSTAAEKLAGIQLGHFGAFYKASWRANDWMYGRLDAAERFVQVLLNPDRLRLLASHTAARPESSSGWALSELERIAWGDEQDQEARSFLEEKWDRSLPRVKQELAYLDKPEELVPERLPACSEAIVRRLHLEILREELTGVAKAVRQDQRQGAWKRAPSVRLFNDITDRKWGSARPLSPREAVRRFDLCELGKERLRNEIGSDLFTRVASQLLAVSVSAGYGARSGLGSLRSLLQIVRAPILAFYAMARNVVLRSRSGVALNTAALTLGAVLVLVHYLLPRAEVPDVLLSLGWIAVVGGILLFLIRKMWWVLGGMLALAIGVGVLRLRNLPVGFSLTLEQWRTLAFILGGLVVFLLFGSFRYPRIPGKARALWTKRAEKSASHD